MNTILWSALLSTTIVLYLIITIPVTNAAPSSSDDNLITLPTENELNISKCDQTEYLSYVNCIRNRNDIRRKRQNNLNLTTTTNNTDNDVQNDNADETDDFSLDCKQLNYECLHQCNLNSTCEAGCPICPINYGDTNQIDGVGGGNDYRTVILEDNNGQSEIFQARIEPGRNITTIIRLTNIINNTHTINIPTNVTNKNLNEIHIHKKNHTKFDGNDHHSSINGIREGGKFGLGETDQGPCCFAVRPKSCTESSMGLRCHHRRHRTCGPHCKSRIVHIQIRNRCHHKKNNNHKKCEKKIAYIPQPKPRCIYISQWPFVVCGTEIPDNHGHGHRKKSCDGCYDHYGYGYSNYHNGGGDGDDHHRGDGAGDDNEDYNDENYDYDLPNDKHEEEKWNKKCRGCYDDAFDTGPLYRRGPVLRPYYYHQPPCFITGTCGLMPMDCGYGCFGDEYTDPAWGGGNNNNEDDEYIYDDDENVGENNNNHHHGNGTHGIDDKNNDNDDDDGSGAGDWAVDLQKCRVVSDDGTIEIRNCSDSEDIENPFASSPKIQLTDDNNEDLLEYNARHRRQIKKHYREKERRQHKRHLNDNTNNNNNRKRTSDKNSRYPTINSDEEDNYVDYNEDEEQIQMVRSKIIEDDEDVGNNGAAGDGDDGNDDTTNEYDDHPYNPNHVRKQQQQQQRRQRKKPHHHHRRREYVYNDVDDDDNYQY